jgi:hypothetical protein
VAVIAAPGDPLEANREPTDTTIPVLPAVHKRSALHQYVSPHGKGWVEQHSQAAPSRGIPHTRTAAQLAAPKLANVGRVAVKNLDHLCSPSSAIRLGPTAGATC